MLDGDGAVPRQSLSTAAARTLATVTKSVPQMQAITPRWLLRLLPWVEVPGGTYRVNRRLTYMLGDGRVSFVTTGPKVDVIPQELRDLPFLRELAEDEILGALAQRFQQREVAPGEVVAEAGAPADRLFLVARGRLEMTSVGKFGGDPLLGVLGDGDYFGDQAFLEPEGRWRFTVKATSAAILLALPRAAFAELVERFAQLRAHLERVRALAALPTNKKGEADIELASGHDGEPELPRTFVDYDPAPREYELSVAQTILRIHTRVADLYNNPMDQTEQQLRLTVEALRERQEWEMLNNREFGLLHNVDVTQRIHSRIGPPTPEMMDELVSRRRKSRFFLAHPRAIAAFGRECTRRGIYPTTVCVEGSTVMAWRGVPILPSDKIPITPERTSSILCLRTGEDDEGVIGLRQTGIPDEREPGLSVRFMRISQKGIIHYLVSAYFSIAALVPDAFGVLEDVQIGRYEDGR